MRTGPRFVCPPTAGRGAPYAITGSATLDARFPGQWYQLEAGLHYNWHRHYDPTLGRYTQPDPLGFVDGPSVYAYARSSPQMAVDPEGLLLRRLDPTIPGKKELMGGGGGGGGAWGGTRITPAPSVVNRHPSLTPHRRAMLTPSERELLRLQARSCGA